jgi:hypothetical protein
MRLTRSVFIMSPICALVIAASSCSAFATVDTAATATAQFTPVAEESTAVRQTLDVQATQVAATAVAAETYIIQMEGINQQLLSTLRVVIPPTQQIVGNAGAVTPGMNEMAMSDASGALSPAMTSEVGAASFNLIATASGVNSADSCPIDNKVQFTPNDPRIYVTARAFNVTAGTLMNAAWSFNGSVVYDADSFTIETDDSDYCLYFYISPQDVAFSLGSWSVQLFANGVPIMPTASFTIVEP